MSKNVPSNHEPPISPADWDAIVAAAFSPDAEPHVFSDRYQKQKQKQEEFLMPKKLVFHSTNTYYELMKPTIEQKQKEAYKNND